MQAKLTSRLVTSLVPRQVPYEVVDAEIKGFLLRVQPSGVMTYYYSYRMKAGRRARYRIGRPGSITPMQARDEAQQLSARVITGEDVQATKKQARLEAARAKYHTLDGLLEHKYGPWVKAERKTGQETIDRIKANFAHLLNRPMGEISDWDIQKWRVERLKAGKAKTTINRDVGALKACLSQAVEWQLLAQHPLGKLKPLKTDRLGRVRYLTVEEETRLRVALSDREKTTRQKRLSANAWRRARGRSTKAGFAKDEYTDYLRPMVLLTLNTGLRLGETLSLEWTYVNLEDGTLTLRGNKTKSGQGRHIPLNQEATDVLSQWRGQSDAVGLVFPGPDGRRMRSVRKAWASILREAEIVNFRWHDLRHHFASRLVMRRVDLNTVRELLGHADLEMTLRYAHLSPEHKAEAVGRLDDEAAVVEGGRPNNAPRLNAV